MNGVFVCQNPNCDERGRYALIEYEQVAPGFYAQPTVLCECGWFPLRMEERLPNELS